MSLQITHDLLRNPGADVGHVPGELGQIDTHSSAPFFGPQTQVNDHGACTDIQPAAQLSLTAPPKTTIFQPLINWVYG